MDKREKSFDSSGCCSVHVLSMLKEQIPSKRACILCVCILRTKAHTRNNVPSTCNFQHAHCVQITVQNLFHRLFKPSRSFSCFVKTLMIRIIRVFLIAHFYLSSSHHGVLKLFFQGMGSGEVRVRIFRAEEPETRYRLRVQLVQKARLLIKPTDVFYEFDEGFTNGPWNSLTSHHPYTTLNIETNNPSRSCDRKLPFPVHSTFSFTNCRGSILEFVSRFLVVCLCCVLQGNRYFFLKESSKWETEKFSCILSCLLNSQVFKYFQKTKMPNNKHSCRRQERLVYEANEARNEMKTEMVQSRSLEQKGKAWTICTWDETSKCFA